MARPLPKDLEQTIKGAASKAESRSSLVTGLIIGLIVGFAFGAAIFGAVGGSFFFLLGALGVGAVWFLAAKRKPKQKQPVKLHYKDIELRD
jgi:predicted lipid-binding transport protein (Tim44 family)